MRVWDINSGYLSNKNLLGEHVEIHAIFSVITNNKKGYANHPETKRWVKNLYALKLRHDLIVIEMNIRNYNHKSPIEYNKKTKFPKTFIDLPHIQFEILKKKYLSKPNNIGRIPLPKNIQELWAQHKYSMMARNPNRYKEIGKLLSNPKQYKITFEKLSLEFIDMLRTKPPINRMTNAIEHMWDIYQNILTMINLIL